MRLHGLIFAASQGVPLVGVSYDPKVTAFLDSVGNENCLQFESLSAKELKNMIDKAVQQVDDKDRRKQSVERLVSAEGLNRQWAKTLLRK